MSTGTYLISAIACAAGISILSAQQPCNGAYTEWNTPRNVNRAMGAQNLFSRYDISYRVNPFYLRGDFNGDEKLDVAIMITEKDTGKHGIALFHGGEEDVIIFGAGNSYLGKGDDFKPLTVWQVFDRKMAASWLGKRVFYGEALYVSKPEASSALIVWNGEKYEWIWMAD